MPLQENCAANTSGRVRFLWADSSPDRRHDWLWIEQHYVSDSLALERCFMAAKRVSTWLRSPNVDPFQIATTCADDLKTLKDGICHHIHTPVALGAGKGMTDVAQKAAAMAHAFSLENPEWSQLSSYLDSFVSITTDLGTESALSGFHVSLRSLFPPWRDLDPLEVDGEDEASAHVRNPDVFDRKYFLQNALPVMGMQRCVHNLLKEVHESLAGWKKFWEDLKNIEALLNWQFRRRRFIATCLRNTHLSCMEDQFESFGGSLYEARWHEVAKFVMKLRPLLNALRSAWDARKYEGGQGDGADPGEARVPGGAGPFNPEALPACLNCPKFAAYVVLVCKMEGLPEQLASWAEGCACHESVCKGLSQYRRQLLLKAHFGPPGICPMAGKRAPELAVGRVKDIFDEMADQALTEIFCDTPLPLQPDVQAEVLNDFNHGRDHIKLLLATKLDFWQRVPWLFCGLAHDDEEVARATAQKILDVLAETPDLELHHRLTHKFLVEELLTELGNFANGKAFCDTTPAFQQAVMPLRFIPVVETIIESKHAVSTRLHKRDTHAGPVMVSLSNRMVVIERRLATPSFFEALSEELQVSRYLGVAPARFGFQKHPVLLELENARGKRDVRAYLQKPLTAVIYRTDIEGQYNPMNDARKDHEQFMRRQQKTVASALQNRGAQEQQLVCLDTVKKNLILDHFRFVATCGEGGRRQIFSLPTTSSAQIVDLLSFLDGADSRQKHRVDAGALDGDGDDAANIDQHMFFTVTKAKPSANHFLRIAPGAGRTIKAGQMAIALHPKQAFGHC